MKKNKIPTFLGLVILVVGLVVGVFLVQNLQIFKSGAAVDAAPKDVRITNITDNSFTVSWVTEKETSGFIKWGDSQSLGKNQGGESDEASFTHSVTVNSLKPLTNYFFKVNSGGDDFDNNGSIWQTQTSSTLNQNSGNTILSGTITDAAGQPVRNALVYVTISGAQPLSTITSGSGAWLIPVSEIRNESLNNLLIVSDSTALNIFANVGPMGVSTAQSIVKNTKPAPPMVLGKVHDFRNLETTSETGVSEASVTLPEGESPTSGFDTTPVNATASANMVTLESISQGEVITTTDPEFFGEGPKGTAITITVESEVVTQSLAIKNDGTWSWSPPSNLEPGTHKITIAWKDANGITRTLVRNFVVSASEGPAFESTPSGSLSPGPSSTATPSPTRTPTPSPSPRVSLTPSATPSILASPTDIATASESPSPILDSGTLTPTIVLAIMGIGTILLGLFVWKKAV